MLIPSIDLLHGRIVQLEQGARLKIASDDVDGWIERLQPFPLIQVIDLDAAKRLGENADLRRRLCRDLPCRVGGGVRVPDDARARLAEGARSVIVGSALFEGGTARADIADRFAAAVGGRSIVAAVDSRGGRVVIHGWDTPLDVTPVQAMRALDTAVGGFLYTHVDTEGMLAGFDLTLARTLAAVTARWLAVAGGIRSLVEVDALDRLGVDAVVGMAIYNGSIDLVEAARQHAAAEGRRRRNDIDHASRDNLPS